jgi:hypothetical protein
MGLQMFKSLRRRGFPPVQTRSTVYTRCQEVTLSHSHFSMDEDKYATASRTQLYSPSAGLKNQ